MKKGYFEKLEFFFTFEFKGQDSLVFPDPIRTSPNKESIQMHYQ